MAPRRRWIPIIALSVASLGLGVLFITLDASLGDPDGGFAFGKLSFAEQLFDAKLLYITPAVDSLLGLYSGLHIGFDLLFMAVYGSLYVLLIGLRQQSRTTPETAVQRRQMRLTIVVGILILVDLVEDALMWGVNGFSPGYIPTSYGIVLGLVTLAKWALVLWVVGSVIPWVRIWSRLTKRAA